MDKPIRYKAKNKKPATKAKAPKKKSDGPTCSMFLSELSRRLTLKKRQEEAEEEHKNIVQTIIESITNALPVIFSKREIVKKDSPTKIETLQTFAPELLPNDTLDVPRPEIPEHKSIHDILMVEVDNPHKQTFKMPKMPVISSEILKQAAANRRRIPTEDAAVNTGGDHDVASELEKHVGTLKKISLIAEEFNQKTAKNLKDIVDSVQEELVKKLEDLQAEQKAINISKQVEVQQEKAESSHQKELD